MTARFRYPITVGTLVALFLIGVLAMVALDLWGVLLRPLCVFLLILYTVGSLLLLLVVRNLEDHENAPSLWTRTYSFGFRLLNRVVPWHRLGGYPGSLNLLALRNDLRVGNLYDTSPGEKRRPPWKPEYRWQRSPDGTYNDLERPMMGSGGTRFGRNVPLELARAEDDSDLLTPSPREVSRRLLTRDTFIPATSLNLLAATWIQFQNHDWFDHHRDLKAKIAIPLRPGDDWGAEQMEVSRTQADPTRSPNTLGGTPTFINHETHWWDASQIYGSTLETQRRVRSFEDGKLRMVDGRLPAEDDPLLPGIDLAANNENWWVGLSLMHILFTREHNAICERLKRDYPSWSDEHLFQTARLINAALIAKIHTVEWTPAILAHPALQISMNGNWTGLLGERYKRAFGRLGESESLSGIPGSPPHHHAAPYYLTEEFVSVYRLHPLIPDDYVFRSLDSHREIGRGGFMEIQGNQTRPVMDNYRLADLFYSFGVMHPGAVTLHNFPRALQNLETIREGRIDLGTIDILRDRERGVPRYNEFRKMLRKPPIRSFRKLTSNRQWAREIEEVYDGDINRVDLMIGMYAEPLPEGFGFSDTAFRIFILMASRRLKSDRFFTTDYRPEVYTQAGLDWVENNNMRSVLKRHFSELTPAIQRSQNVFAPWNRVS